MCQLNVIFRRGRECGTDREERTNGDTGTRARRPIRDTRERSRNSQAGASGVAGTEDTPVRSKQRILGPVCLLVGHSHCSPAPSETPAVKTSITRHDKPQKSNLSKEDIFKA
ncbi:hypothetical protein COCON_G00059370 [Conger conger]|uniref:Uncharacterized protein n=1 Tax=Conger conger TaxID=82655 RepID=A0A9Q1I3A0_CONCO|nr:hypothetical protein COCON_G00059370 [Conger conger]